jgi:3-oxoacyl-[acyl-carrier-protein] synthase-1
MNRAVYIVSAGARTPLGLDAASSAAAVRGAISAARDHPFLVDQVGDPMPAALDAELDPRVMGPERLVALASAALREACVPLAATGASGHPVPLYLALPEYRPGFDERDAGVVRANVAATPELPVTISSVTVAPLGHAAGVAAIAKGIQQIETGACDACLVGGVESYFHFDTMEWLDANLQLAGTVSRSGFVPGEAAGFSLLMSGEACDRHGVSGLARVRSAGTAREQNLIKTPDTCVGEGLTAAVRTAVNPLTEDSQTINAVICDVNGERYRGEEWAFVCLRLGQYFDDPAAYESPADCWGDVGAASGPLFAMLACRAAARGYAKGPNTLIWASSERGLRGAALLDTRDLLQIQS